MSLTLQLPDQFNYDECLWYLDRGMDECLYSIEDNSIIKPISLKNSKTIVQISRHKSFLHIRPLGTQTISNEQLLSYVRSWFDLDRDLDEFYAMAAADPLLNPLTTKYHGLRLIGINDLFEALSWSIIGQQINLRFAYKLKRALVEKFGDCYKFSGRQYHFFPNPEALANASKEDLLALQFSRQKADYMLRLSRSFAEGHISKMSLQGLSLSEVITTLSSLHGIGPWTANYVAMRCLKYMDAFPMGDAGLQNAIKNQWRQKQKPTVAQLQTLSDKWQGWQAYATLFLWRSLSDKL